MAQRRGTDHADETQVPPSNGFSYFVFREQGSVIRGGWCYDVKRVGFRAAVRAVGWGARCVPPRPATDTPKLTCKVDQQSKVDGHPKGDRRPNVFQVEQASHCLARFGAGKVSNHFGRFV